MAVDAGLTAPGFAVAAIDAIGTKNDRLLHYGCFVPTMLEEGRKTLKDVNRIEQIVSHMLDLCELYRPSAIIIELPTGGAKSAAAIKGMAFSTSMTSAALTCYKHYQDEQLEIIYITPIANKKAALGLEKFNVEVDKWDMVKAAEKVWPSIVWPTRKNRKKEIVIDEGKAWAIADACGCLAAYIKMFKVKSLSEIIARQE